MQREQIAIMWAMIASGVASRTGGRGPLSPEEVASETDAILAEYIRRQPKEDEDERSD